MTYIGKFEIKYLWMWKYLSEFCLSSWYL